MWRSCGSPSAFSSRGNGLAQVHQRGVGVVAALGHREDVFPACGKVLGQVVQVHLGLRGLGVGLLQARLEFVGFGAHGQAPYWATAGNSRIMATASVRNLLPASDSFASEGKPKRCTSRNCLLTTTRRPAISTMRPKPSWLIFIMGETIWPVSRSIATAMAL